VDRVPVASEYFSEITLVRDGTTRIQKKDRLLFSAVSPRAQNTYESTMTKVFWLVEPYDTQIRLSELALKVYHGWPAPSSTKRNQFACALRMV
jgi:hypothetical protein